jgi:hypothetical protein
MTCKVKGCRFIYSHTVRSHLCGKCKKFGHGQIECGNDKFMDELMNNRELLSDSRNWCTFEDCNLRQYHNNKAHHCTKCFKKHSDINCIIQNIEYHLNRFNINNFNIEKFRLDAINKYCILSVGMGCSLYIINKNNNLYSIFMHSDSWGQYGENTDDSIILYKHIDELDHIISNNFKHYKFKCPLCRQDGNSNDTFEIKGLEEKCKICLDNNIELYFTKCKHSCCCKTCFDNLIELI